MDVRVSASERILAILASWQAVFIQDDQDAAEIHLVEIQRYLDQSHNDQIKYDPYIDMVTMIIMIS